MATGTRTSPRPPSATNIGTCIVSGDKQLLRIDPYARQVTSSVGNAVVHDPHFGWEDDDFHLPAINELVIYEMHLGTFHYEEDGKSDKFEEAVQKLDHLQRLGVNVIEVMGNRSS
jgi:1,4-alpha-glucan branching enzyme